MTQSERPSIKTPKNGAQFFGTVKYPISRAVRAGDFVITSALCAAIPDTEDQVFSADGIPLSLGKHRKAYSFAEEVHGTFKVVMEALAMADCTLADVVDCQVWLKDPRDFPELNHIYAQYFTDNYPVRSVFHNHFMADLQIEIKMVAYKPRGT